MRYEQINPPEYLKGIIRCYWTLNGDAGAGIKYKVIPDCCMDIIRFLTPYGRVTQVVGTFDKPFECVCEGWQDVFGIRFLPGAFYLLSGIPASDLFSEIHDLGSINSIFRTDQLFPENIDETTALINHLNIYFRRFAGLSDNFASELVARCHQNDTSHSFLEHYSMKTFNRRMLERTGMNNRSFIKVVRFQRALSLLWNHGYSHSDAAYSAGYSDQPHMIRDFKEYTGKTPMNFLKEIDDCFVRFVQYPLGLF